MFGKKRDIIYVQMVPAKKSGCKTLVEFLVGMLLAGLVIWVWVLASAQH